VLEKDIKKFLIPENRSIWAFLGSAYLKTLLLWVAIFIIYYVGNYGWLTLNITLLDSLGYSFAKSLIFVCFTSIGFIVGSMFAIHLVDKVERKWFCFYTAIIWAIALLIIGFFPNHIVIMVFGFIATVTISAIMPVMYIYVAENFSTTFRATGVSLADGLGHLGGAFCGQIIFSVYYLFEQPAARFAAALTTMALSAIVVAVLFVFGKKTKGLNLTAINTK
jgi:putative MFS transporter